MNPLPFPFSSSQETGQLLASRLKTLRLLNCWTRKTLASRAGVSEATLRRFETTGQASLSLVLRLATALSRLQECQGLFQPPPAASIAELEARTEKPLRQRGRI